MKNKFNLILAFVCVFALQAQAQDWRPGFYMKQALDITLAKASIFEMASDYGYTDGICFMGVYLDEGEDVGWGARLEGGREYVFIGGGDDDVTDIDIKILDDYGNVLEEDVLDDNNPVVKFMPKKSGTYNVRLKLYSCDAAGSFCAMTIMQEHANSVPVSSLDNAVETVIGYGEYVNEQYPVKFHDIENQWCLFGAIIASGDYETITNLDLGFEDHILIAAGDDNLNDADLFLMDDNDNILEKDVEKDAIPAIRYTTKGTTSYKLKIKNEDSNGKSLLITCVLTE
ncbi:MAG: hypothetical protein KDC34_17005 [Saprospiraceae bacterium]|nr:hypothetical protein [Saprospiraceae bacterium]